jgi:sulfite reductase subunit B
MSKLYVLKKDRLPDFVSALSSRRRVVAPVAKGETSFAYEEVAANDPIALKHIPTILPPKKFFMPQVETIQRFDMARKQWEPVIESCPDTVIFGVHTCDLAGIDCLNQAMGSDPQDVNYAAKRDNILLVAIECTEYCDKYASCAVMGNHTTDAPHDVMFTEMNGGFAVQANSEAGEALLQESGLGLLTEAQGEDQTKLDNLRSQKDAAFTPEIDATLGDLRNLLVESFDSKVWDDIGDRCLSCGNCTNVCPTCYCFDVKDELDLTLTAGVRNRVWDSCQNEEFALVAGGENFRKQRGARQRHRYMKKLNFALSRYDRFFCTGCGRCTRTCMADISLKDTLNALASEHRASKLAKMSPYQVMVGTILRTRKMTDLEMYYEIELEDCELEYEPGQFVMISLPGIGEAPISISSSPHKKGAFELVIRKAGVLTTALHQLQPGATVGIRGPYGRGFPVKDLEGKDVVLIGGGCGNIPLHSLIDSCMHEREKFGKIDILLGCRTPKSMLFTDEFDGWRSRPNVNMAMTVDVADEAWSGHVGLITALIPELQIDPDKTCAVVVGPPAMYKFVIQELKKKNIPDEQIVLSLERHMKCGVGKCGHCQIGELYCCQDGPVFTYAEIKNKYEAL